jgi:signal transduction histidine kinase
MTIKTRLRLLVAGTCLLLCGALICLFLAERRIGVSLEKSSGAFSLLSGIAELNMLSNEFDGGNIERLEQQWKQRILALRNELHMFSANFPQTEGLRKLETDFDQVDELFVNFVSFARRADGEKTGPLAVARNYLLSHFSVVLNAIESDAKMVASEAQETIEQVQFVRNVVLYSIFIVFLSVLWLWWSFICKGVLNPVERLHEGVLGIRDGRLGCTINVPSNHDEMTELAVAFNDMSLRLREVTVSRDDLQNEVCERKRAESALRESQRQVFAAGERERARIGRELHDGVCQDISAIRLHLGAAVRTLEAADKTAAAGVERVNSFILKILEDMRRIVMDLRPATLDEIGLVATLRWKCRQIRGLKRDIDLSLETTVEEERIPDVMKGPLYRIVQEALNNTIRHSGASSIEVRLVCEGDILVLTIMDNGCGFDVDDTHGGGYGLSNMRERACAFGGTFYMDGSDGTYLEVRIPLAREENGTAA